MRRLAAHLRVKPLLSALLVITCLLAVASAASLGASGASLPFALSAKSAPRSPDAAGLKQLGSEAVPTTGCGKAPQAPPGTSTQQDLHVGALLRHYRLHVPSTYQASELTPLVLSFHGRGATPVQDEQLTGLSQLADLHRFIAVYPQGAADAKGVTGWNTGRRQDPTVDDVLFVDSLITHLQQTLCVDPQRIYAMGFSNGGGMTALLACDLADRFAAFAPVAGDYYPQPGGCRPARAAPIVELHGTADGVNPYNGNSRLRYPAVGTWLTDWAQLDGCGSEPTITHVAPSVAAEAWGDCHDGAAIQHYRLAGVGHVWPSHTRLASLSPGFGSFDATTAIWAFFTRFALPAPNPTAPARA